MIAQRSRGRSRRSLLAAAWWGSALTAALALIGLVVISGVPGNGGLALRADTYNQMTGIGSTASAVTVNWTGGLLDSSNQPITSATDGTDGGAELNPNADRAAGSGSPLSFMDSGFKSLQVTVSQTENIGQQGITVSWTGVKLTPPPQQGLTNFMQMMECYGDSDSGPSPEDCLFGSDSAQGPATLSGTTGDSYLRSGSLCGTGGLGSTAPSTTDPPAPAACDPFEPAAETVPHCDP